MRKETKIVQVGPVAVGGGYPVSVQSMTTTATTDISATLKQIKHLADAGCEIVRVSIPDTESAKALKYIAEKSPLPVVADIHFLWHLAVEAANSGVAKIRVNPGNIGSLEDFAKIIKAIKNKGTVLRIGVNSGSLNPKYEELSREEPAEALVKSALEYLDFAVSKGLENIVLSVKSSSVTQSIEAYRMLSRQTDFPLHLGITESGTLLSGSIKSAVGLGVLLEQGIGDTMRVSLTDDPVREIEVAYKILQALGIRQRGVDIISCPTCARCKVDIISIASEVEKRLEKVEKPIKVAIMGCVVNGPGEAKDADVGIASGKKSGLLFAKGEIIGKYPEDKLVEILIKKVFEITRET